MCDNIIDKRTKGEWMLSENLYKEPLIYAKPHKDGFTNYIAKVCVLELNDGEPKANAAFIVKACNEYEYLIAGREILKDEVTHYKNEYESLVNANKELLEAFKEMCEVQGNGMGLEMNAYNKAKEAIKKHSPQ